MRAVILYLIATFISTCNGQAVLILARGDSKGIKLKNLQKVGSFTLLARAIITAKSAGIDDVTVSTDHLLIALEAIKHGASAFHRNHVTASDFAPSIWGAAEFLAHRKDVSTVLLLQATSPFIKPEHLQDAVRKLLNPVAYDCVFSVTRSFKLRWQSKNNRVHPINFKLEARPRRQDWSGELLETGAFYLSRANLIKDGYFQNNNCTTIEVSAEESLEVDTYTDLKLANAMLSDGPIYSHLT